MGETIWYAVFLLLVITFVIIEIVDTSKKKKWIEEFKRMMDEEDNHEL